MNITEMATKDLEYYTHLINKAVVHFKWVGPNFKQVILWERGHHIASHTTEKP
jgi:hypothetical protein